MWAKLLLALALMSSKPVLQPKKTSADWLYWFAQRDPGILKVLPDGVHASTVNPIRASVPETLGGEHVTSRIDYDCTTSEEPSSQPHDECAPANVEAGATASRD